MQAHEGCMTMAHLNRLIKGGPGQKPAHSSGSSASAFTAAEASPRPSMQVNCLKHCQRRGIEKELPPGNELIWDPAPEKCYKLRWSSISIPLLCRV